MEHLPIFVFVAMDKSHSLTMRCFPAQFEVPVPHNELRLTFLQTCLMRGPRCALATGDSPGVDDRLSGEPGRNSAEESRSVFTGLSNPAPPGFTSGVLPGLDTERHQDQSAVEDA